MATVQLQTIEADARVMADQVGSTFVTSAQATRWINQDYRALWDLLVLAAPDRFRATSTINTTSGTKEYALPADFLHVLAVHVIDGDKRYPIEPFQLQERHIYEDWRFANVGGWMTTRFRVMGHGSAARIHFEPDPETKSYELVYVQAPTELVNPTDTLEGVNGWEEYIVYSVAIRMKEKEESDTTSLRADLMRIGRRIQAMAADRNAGRPARVNDTRRYLR